MCERTEAGLPSREAHRVVERGGIKLFWRANVGFTPSPHLLVLATSERRVHATGGSQWLK